MAIRYSHDFYAVASVRIEAERRIGGEQRGDDGRVFYVRDIVLLAADGTELYLSLCTDPGAEGLPAQLVPAQLD